MNILLREEFLVELLNLNRIVENSLRLDYADEGNSISSSFSNYARRICPRIRDFLTSALSHLITNIHCIFLLHPFVKFNIKTAKFIVIILKIRKKKPTQIFNSTIEKLIAKNYLHETNLLLYILLNSIYVFLLFIYLLK